MAERDLTGLRFPRMAGPPPGPRREAPRPKVVGSNALKAIHSEALKLGSAGSLQELSAPGRSSLLLSPPSSLLMRAFRALSRRRSGMLISGTHPKLLRSRYGIEGAELLWLTELPGASGKSYGPQDLEYDLLARAAAHMRRRREALVLLDDTEYLSALAGFEPLLRFVKGLSDLASDRSASFLADVDPRALSARELLALSKCFDAVKVVEEERSHTPAPGLPLPASVSILIRPGPEAYGLLAELSGAKKALCITPTPPKKLWERYGLAGVSFVWLTETGEGEEALPPTKLSFEVQKRALDHLCMGRGALLFLDEIEHLRPYTSFQEELRLVKCLCDAAAEHGGNVVAALNLSSYEEREAAALRKRFDVVSQPVSPRRALEARARD
ncbi:MAG: DUF835 domain-containing protein [Thermoplasmatota archaeon]